MKSLIALIVGILCLCQSVDAQELASFRFQSTASLMNDDLDLMLDPLELGYTKGYRLYSNLSNLGTGQEEAIGSSSDNTLVLGIGGDVPFVVDARGALFLISRGAREALPVGLDLNGDGWDEFMADGEVSGDYEDYFDSSGDGLYDYRVHRDGVRVNKSETSLRQMVAVTNFEIDKWEIGVRIKSSFENQGDNLDDSWNYRHYNLESSYMTNAINSYDGANSVSEDRLLGLDIAMSTNYWGSELGCVLSIGRWKNSSGQNSENINYDGHYNDQNNILDEEGNDITQKQESEFNRTGIGLELRLRRQLKESNERRQEDFYEIKGMFKHWGGTGENITENGDESFDSDDEWYDRDWSQSLDRLDGDDDVSLLEFSGRWVKNLDEQVRVALGVSMARTLWAADQDGAYRFNSIDSSLYIDGVINRWDSWIIGSSRYSYNQKSEMRVDEMRFPIALEYEFGKRRNWMFRLSATYEASKTVSDEIKQIQEIVPYIDEIYHGDGSYAVAISENEYSSHAAHTVRSTSNTRFAYGLGYEPTPSLQVDFMSFFGSEDNALLDASFYRNLRLSATFKF